MGDFYEMDLFTLEVVKPSHCLPFLNHKEKSTATVILYQNLHLRLEVEERYCRASLPMKLKPLCV